MSELIEEQEIWPPSEYVGRTRHHEASDIARHQLARIRNRYLMQAHFLELQSERQRLENELQELHGEVKVLREDVEGIRSIIANALREPIRRTDRGAAINLLTESLQESLPKESQLYLYKTSPSELQASIVVPDENYFTTLDSVLNLNIEIHKRYDLKTDLVVFRRSEVDILPREETERTIEY